jgi:hypothetical protein
MESIKGWVFSQWKQSFDWHREEQDNSWMNDMEAVSKECAQLCELDACMCIRNACTLPIHTHAYNMHSRIEKKINSGFRISVPFESSFLPGAPAPRKVQRENAG